MGGRAAFAPCLLLLRWLVPLPALAAAAGSPAGAAPRASAPSLRPGAGLAILRKHASVVPLPVGGGETQDRAYLARIRRARPICATDSITTVWFAAVLLIGTGPNEP